MVAKRIRDFSEGAAQIVLHLIFFSAVQNFIMTNFDFFYERFMSGTLETLLAGIMPSHKRDIP